MLVGPEKKLIASFRDLTLTFNSLELYKGLATCARELFTYQNLHPFSFEHVPCLKSLMHLWVDGDTHTLQTVQIRSSESRECGVLSRSYVKFVSSLLLPLGFTFCHASSSLPGYWWMRTQQHEVGNDLDSFPHLVTAPWTILQDFNAKFKYSPKPDLPSDD